MTARAAADVELFRTVLDAAQQLDPDEHDQLYQALVCDLRARRPESISPNAATTVRRLICDGRLEATRIGKRQWRVRRDAVIAPATGRTATITESPAARAQRILGGGK